MVDIVGRFKVPPDPERAAFLKKIEEKWQEAWLRDGVFEADPDPSCPKFFVTFPYPYINAYPHLGSAFTVLRVDIIARYMRMKGYNVLFAQGWHATGGPIMAAALRIREGDPKQIRTLKMMGIPDEEIPKFSEPVYWVKFFKKAWREDFKRYGLSIDWRREFNTTYLNPPYNAFIQWQYTVLRERGYITKGSHPVVWCPKERKVVGDHDRPDEYAGISPEEVVVIKFQGEDGLVYPCMTYRPETVYGAVNIWVNPDAEYVIAEVDGEKWVIGSYAVDELRDQGHKVTVIGSAKGRDLVGRFAVNPVTKWRVPVLPASFVDPEAGMGVVMSVPAHAPYDYVALEDLKRDPYILDRYNVDPAIVDAIKPVPLIILEGYSDLPAKDAVEKRGIRSQVETEKLDDATKEIYTKEFHKGVLRKEVYGRWGGLTVAEAKESIIDYLTSNGVAIRHYTLPVPVYCRCGARTHVKIVQDQWFLRYSDPEWKELAHKCIDSMRFIPDSVRQQFHSQVDWYKDWACTHKGELGTPLPWDPDWVLESLSDSTVYMAYYTLAKYLQHPEKYGIDWGKLSREFFDYVLLGKGDPEEVARKTGISRELLKEMREEFLYWYPVDLRVSGKDLLPNHLVFFIFHHVAIFPPEFWPRGIGINGWVLVGGEKMSKSKGNFILLREALDLWGADATRFAEAYAGNSGLDDANFEPEMAAKAVDILYEWYRFAVENYGEGDDDWFSIDDWFRSVLHRTLKEVEREMEELNFKNVLVKGFFNLQNNFRWYLKRRGGRANKRLLAEFIEIQTKILAPITPHIAEEIWRSIGKEGYISLSPWPKVDEDAIKPEVELAEEIVKEVIEDIKDILGILKAKPSEVVVAVAAPWKYFFVSAIKREVEKGAKLREAAGKAIKELPREQRKVAGRVIPIITSNPRILELLVSREEEERILREAAQFISREVGVKVRVTSEEEAVKLHRKASQALPARPAIIAI